MFEKAGKPFINGDGIQTPLMLSVRRALGLCLAVLVAAATLQANNARSTASGSSDSGAMTRPGQAFGDLNGDGRDDVLLRHSDGRWYYYPMNGRNVLPTGRGGATINRNLDWQLVGIGDLNGDGKDDVLVRRSSDGLWYYYPMNGRLAVTAQRGIADITTDPDWQFAGIGDLNGDGNDDLLLRHSDGSWRYYPMNGREHIADQQGEASLTTDPDWQFAGIGDLNGDGKDDVLLRHTDGRWYYYPMDGREPLAEGRGLAYITAGLDWQLAGMGDLNGDGNDDVLLRRITDGRWYYYPMNGRHNFAEQRGVANLTADLNWRLAGMGDLNGDGKDDVLLRHNHDRRWLYYPMNGRQHISAGNGTANLTTDANWVVAGTGGNGSIGGSGSSGGTGSGADGNGDTGDNIGNSGSGGSDESDGTGSSVGNGENGSTGDGGDSGGTGGTGVSDGTDGTGIGAPVGNDDHSDARSGATRLALGGSVTGHIDPGNDVDYFVVHVSGPGTLTLHTTGSLDTKGELQDSAGTKLAEHDDVDLNTDRNFRIAHTVSAGSYYVRVESYRTNTGGYILYAQFSGGGSNDSNDGGDNNGDNGSTGGNDDSGLTTTPVDDLLLPEMVPIAGGSFQMGNLNDTGPAASGVFHELPVHPVTVRSFKLSKHEVTFAQWDACVEDGGCADYSPGDEGWGRANRPVININWFEPQGYINWLNSRTGGNYRLPTEAEWEYAARAGSTTKYSWGNDIGNNRANCGRWNDECGDGYEYTAPVGSFPANAWGLHDMNGNVAELVEDCWHGNYRGAPEDGSAWTIDCDDPASHYPSYEAVVIRGGSWDSGAKQLRSAARWKLLRSYRHNTVGFRVAQDDRVSDDHSNTRSGATNLTLNSSLSGQIETHGDVDFFRVQVNGSGMLRVYTTGNYVDTFGELQSRSGLRLASHDDKESDGSSGSGWNFRIEHQVSAGTYYISVKSKDKSFTGGYKLYTFGSYTLHVYFSNGDIPEIEMVSIPGGSFQMGDLMGDLRGERQTPVHPVTVRPFKLGKFEVTFAQWDACVADGGCPNIYAMLTNVLADDPRGWGRGRRPVINVHWRDVQLYVDWLNNKTGGGYRLPTEAEWEYAARAGVTTKYSWGDDIGHNRANCRNDVCHDSYFKQTAPVGSFPANTWGLHDMHGNVSEWVQDCYNESYIGAPSDGSAWLSGDCDYRMVRGGSWNDIARYLRSDYRLWYTRGNRNLALGFRLARDN